jgi:hypothetical protein
MGEMASRIGGSLLVRVDRPPVQNNSGRQWLGDDAFDP